MTRAAGRKTTRLVSAAVVAGALLLGACGGDDGGGGGSASGEDFCDDLRALSDAEVFGEDPDFSDPDSLRPAFEEARRALDALGDDVPSEIAGEFATVQGGLTGIIDLFEEYDYDLAALAAEATTNPAITEQLESFGGAEFEAASERLSEYGEQECGIQPDTTGG
jgi:hypothetical protein